MSLELKRPRLLLKHLTNNGERYDNWNIVFITERGGDTSADVSLIPKPSPSPFDS